MSEATTSPSQSEGKFIPFLFHCYECDTTHSMVDGTYVFENEEGVRAKDSKFFCVKSAIELWSEETVDAIFADAPENVKAAYEAAKAVAK